MTGPVPKECLVWRVSMSIVLRRLVFEELAWDLSRRRQMKTPRRIREMLRTTQMTIPAIAPPLSLQGVRHV